MVTTDVREKRILVTRDVKQDRILVTKDVQEEKVVLRTHKRVKPSTTSV